jgi:hypothetical protein
MILNSDFVILVGLASLVLMGLGMFAPVQEKKVLSPEIDKTDN